MKTIQTKYIPASNVRGSRITATDNDGHRVIISYNSAASNEDAHAIAAAELCARMGWHGTMIGGHLKHGMVFVFDDDLSPRFTVKRKARTA